jgi:hypothetical protein
LTTRLGCLIIAAYPNNKRGALKLGLRGGPKVLDPHYLIRIMPAEGK